MIKIRNFLWSYWHIFKEWCINSITKYLPKFYVGNPPYPIPITCPDCGEWRTKLCAIDTGDGWVFVWECENYCGNDGYIENWFPFYFGWCNGKDLKRYGIEVL